MTTTTDTPYNPAPHKMDLELFEESTRGDVAAMRTSASADAIVDRIMSNPHLGDIVAAARDRDREVVQAQRIQRDAAEVLRHRSDAIDALTADRDRLAERARLGRVTVAATADALAELLAVPNVREADLRAALADILRIQRHALAMIDSGTS